MSFLNITESINFAPKEIKPQLQSIVPLFQDKEDFYADKSWNKSSSQPWKILITADNFSALEKKKVGKKVPPPKNMRARGRQKDALEVIFGKYKIIFVNVGPSSAPGRSQTAQQERGTAWILRRTLRDNIRYESWEDIMKDPKYYQLLDVYPNVNPEWLQSFYKQQETMLKEFSDSKWNEFNRDGGFMQFISDLVRVKFGISKKDTWNPADIWMVYGKQDKIEKMISDQLDGSKGSQTIYELNSIMRSLYKERKIVGVSLKLISGNKAKYIEYNIKDMTLDERDDYNYDIESIKIDFSLKGDVSKNPANWGFGTQDTTIKLKAPKSGNRYKFQIKDLGGGPPGGNLKFEGTDPAIPKARAGKSPEAFTKQLFKDYKFTFENKWQNYPSTIQDFKNNINDWKNKFNLVNKYRGVSTNCETAEQFISNVESVYLQETRKGYDGAWIARSKLMQLDFLYNSLSLNSKQQKEFFTDMAFIGMKMGGSQGVFGPFGKLA